MSAEIHVGDVGTIFEATVKDEDGAIVNISAATTLHMVFRRPNRHAVTKAATLSSSGVDGKMRYVAQVDDLDAAGLWSLQGFVVLPDGAWHSDKTSFVVHANL